MSAGTTGKQRNHRIGSRTRQEKQPNRPKPMSSHPEADPLSTKSLVTESDLKEYEKERSGRKPIVSVNGEDVQPDIPPRRAA